MEVKELLHMKAGDGEDSYAQNQATFTQKVAIRTKPMLETAIRLLLFSEENQTLAADQVLKVADFGCGPAPTAFVSTVVETADKIYVGRGRGGPSERSLEIQVHLNDLVSNDFNSLFRQVAGLCRKTAAADYVGDAVSLFIAGVPGSFHGRLFPAATLHLVHSSYSIHWLSQVPRGLCTEEGFPINKGNIYVSKTSPPAVAEAYFAQFEEDFSSFLDCRSIEVVPNGCMVLAFRGRSPVDRSTWEPWELKLFNQALSNLVSQRMVEEGKVDSFNFPFYAASQVEIKNIVEQQGSFAVELMEILTQHVADEIKDKLARAGKLANVIRSYTESLIAHHFGSQVVEPLYDELAHLAFEFLANESPEHLTISVLLRRKTEEQL